MLFVCFYRMVPQLSFFLNFYSAKIKKNLIKGALRTGHRVELIDGLSQHSRLCRSTIHNRSAPGRQLRQDGSAG